MFAVRGNGLKENSNWANLETRGEK